MSFYFDKEIDKTNTNSSKWEFTPVNGEEVHNDRTHASHGANRVLPMGVADMDFRAPPEVIEALTRRAANGVFGYASPDDRYFETLKSWFSRHYNWDIESEWVEVTPGVVPTLNMLVQQFTHPGEKVLIHRPIYHPFIHAINNNNRELVTNTLIEDNGRYRMDFDDLETKTADPAVKLALLSSPHNPVGRVWSREELQQFGQICLKNNVLVVADEVHCDLIFSGFSFQPFATIQADFAQNCIVCTAPSKTFNLAGLKTSNIIVPNPDLKAGLTQVIQRNGLYGKNIFGLVGCQAAYEHGEAWLTAVLAYIEANYTYLKSQLETYLPQLRLTPLEGTYLAWIDFRALQLSQEALDHFILEELNIFCNSGYTFGPEGSGFMRFNLACHRHILAEMVERLKTAIN